MMQVVDDETTSRAIFRAFCLFILSSSFIFVLSTFKHAFIKIVPTSVLWFLAWLVTSLFLTAPSSIGSKVFHALSKTLPKQWRNTFTLSSSTQSINSINDLELLIPHNNYIPVLLFILSTLFYGWKGLQAQKLANLHRAKISDSNISKIRRKVSELRRNQIITEDIRAKMDRLLVRNENKGVSKEGLLRQISSDIGLEFGTETKLEMQNVCILDDLVESATTTTTRTTTAISPLLDVTFPSATIERRLKMELGLLSNTALDWWELILDGNTCNIDEHDTINIDKWITLETIATWCDAKILANTNLKKDQGRTSITCASIVAILPIDLIDQNNHPGVINHEMFAEIHRFIVNTFISYLNHHQDAMLAWQTGCLRLGDGGNDNNDNNDNKGNQVQHSLQYETPLEENDSNRMPAGSLFRMRCYNRPYKSNELYIVFEIPWKRRYIFVGRWQNQKQKRNQNPTINTIKYSWMTTAKLDMCVTSIGQIIDIFWPYLCYIKQNSNHQILASKYFKTSHYRHSWTLRYAKRIRHFLTTRSKNNSQKCIETIRKYQRRHCLACVSGVGLSLNGKIVILPNFVMLKIWSFANLKESKPTLRGRNGKALLPPPPKVTTYSFI
jgi:hypothetical protein